MASATLRDLDWWLGRWELLNSANEGKTERSAHLMLFRSIDWSKTSLGTFDSWSESVLSQITSCLACPFPTLLCFGSDLTCVYNVPYAQQILDKHPRIFGTPYREAYEEVWYWVEPCMHAAEHYGTVTSKKDDPMYLKRRNDFIELCYYDWSIGPIWDIQGRFIGVHIPNNDQTDRVVNSRRLDCLRSLDHALSGASTRSHLFDLALASTPATNDDCPILAIYDSADLALRLHGTLGIGSASFFPHEVASGVTFAASSVQVALQFVWNLKQPRKVLTVELDASEGLLSPLKDRITILIFSPIMFGDRVQGIIIHGLNPRRLYDTAYETFVRLWVNTISIKASGICLHETLQFSLEEKSRSLQKAEIQFAAISDQSPAGLWMADSNKKIIFTNPAWHRLLGIPPGDENNFGSYLHPDDVDESTRKYENSFTGVSEPIYFRCKAFPDATLHSTQVAKYNEDGSLAFVTGSVTDISETKRAERLEAKRRQDAEEMKMLQERLVDVVSHELRTPIAALLLAASSAQTIAEEAGMTELEADFASIKAATQHMKNVINDTLNISKNSALEVESVPCRVQDLLTSAQAMFRSDLIDKGMQLTTRMLPGFSSLSVEYILTDPRRVSQILINLITNAIKFTHNTPGQQLISITTDISAQRPVLPGATPLLRRDHAHDLFLIFRVSDTGRGLKPEDFQHLFRRFSQVSTADEAEGSGMGLFISSQLAEKLDGRVAAEALDAGGACFSFYVKVKRCAPPLSLVPSRSPVLSKTQISGTSGSTSHRPLRLILAEDNVLLQRLTHKQLSKLGHEVLVADNGQIAIDLLQNELANKRTIHLVLLDVEMPVLDGPATVKRMHQLGIVDIPCIAVTANARKEQQDALLLSGMSSVVSKPFQMEQLCETMYSWVKV